MGKQLSALDLAFLGLETQRTPVNVAVLQILETPPAYKGNFVRDMLDQLAQQKPGPPFNLKLHTSIVGVPQWVVDEHFDLAYHVRHSALPAPGDMSELLTLVSRLHSRVMDRQRPLWEYHVIEGLRNGRFAIYLKMHHAAIDGMGGIALLESCYNETPDAPIHAPWQGLPASKKKSRPRTGLLPVFGSLVRGATEQLKMAPDLGKLLAGHGLKTMGLKHSDSPSLFSAPKSLFNGNITGARRFAIKSISLTQIKELSRKTGATVNDIILAVCSGALRSYLLKHKALPEKSLIATIPVSIRQIKREGNRITYVAAHLATNIKNPLRRLAEIRRSTTEAKAEMAAVMPSAATTFAVVAQGMVAVLNRFQLARHLPPPANVVISNVPGPRKPLYFGGARMLANYPLSVLVDGQALNITVVSYCDSVDFGLMACRDTIGDVDTIADYVGESFHELSKAAREAPKTDDKKASRKKKARPARKTGSARTGRAATPRTH